jgi:rhamnogalacturonan acetylesterase
MIPISSSQTPRNGWTNGAISAGPRFVGYAQLVAQRKGTNYIDHYAYVAQTYNRLGQATVNTHFPQDAVHTSATGARVVAQSFVRGLLCNASPLKNFVNSVGQSVPGECRVSEYHFSMILNLFSDKCL